MNVHLPLIYPIIRGKIYPMFLGEKNGFRLYYHKNLTMPSVICYTYGSLSTTGSSSGRPARPEKDEGSDSMNPGVVWLL